jgi:hypothetical protein
MKVQLLRSTPPSRIPGVPANRGRMKMPNAIGDVPTEIVPTMALVAVAMTDTVWSNWFGDVSLATVRRECDADGAVADGDRCGHSVSRRGDHRYGIV